MLLGNALPKAARERQGTCQANRVRSDIRCVRARVAGTERDAVSSAVLCVVQTAVRSVQEPVEGRSVIGCEGATDRNGEVEMDVVVHDWRVADDAAEAFGSPGERLRRADAGQKDGELLATPPRQAVSRLDGGAQTAGEVDEDGVADGVSVGVVDLFEVIGIKQQQSASGGARRDRLGGDLGKVTAVEGAGEFIGAC